MLVLLSPFKYICKHPPCTGTKGEMRILVVMGF